MRVPKPTKDELYNEVDRLREAVNEYDWILGQQTYLLTMVANALKGPPPEHSLHDWSDLPYMARALVQELASYHETDHIQHVPPEPKREEPPV